jgi:hypothetical protein
MKSRILLFIFAVVFFTACDKNDHPGHNPYEDPASFAEISSTQIGGEGAAEISAYDPITKKLFVIVNTGDVTRIDILNLSNPATPLSAGSIDVSAYGGNVNSVDVHDGKLAAAVESFNKTDNGKVVIFRTSDNSFVREVNVGALPDMITYSHDGKYILTANEGEPNDDYTVDPLGTVSIISVFQNYAVVTLDFSAFAGQANFLKSKGLRVFGPGASFAQDMEPEYITVSFDSKTAWVTLQENNAIAKIDIRGRSITNIFPLGFKDYSIGDRIIDPSDKNGYLPASWNVKGMYQPDAIALIEDRGIPFLFTANEGDVREYNTFEENERVKDITLDPAVFPNAASLQLDENLGRLNITTTLGKNSNGEFSELYSFGARSFSVWNGYTGNLLFDSKNDLETRSFAAGIYADSRSDDKGVEPEGITIGVVGRKPVAFVGLERVDAVLLYDVSNPVRPKFIKLLTTGDAPEGILLISSNDSPTGKSLLVVSSEDDGTVKIYSTN